MELTREQTQDLVERIVEAAHPQRMVSQHSDIDVLVVVEEGAHRRKTAQRIYRQLLGFRLPVDVVVATASDIERYRDSPGLVYREALREGKELYAA
jgi:predicted nucleotidyltransferase